MRFKIFKPEKKHDKKHEKHEEKHEEKHHGPPVPNKVDKAHLHKGYLVSKEGREKFIQLCKEHPDEDFRLGKKATEVGDELYSKGDFDSKRTLLGLHGKAYAIYEGGSKIIGKGGIGEVKWMQDLETKEFLAVKIVDIKMKKGVEPKEVGEARNLEMAKRGFGHLVRNEPGKQQIVIAMEFIPGTGYEKAAFDDELELYTAIIGLGDEVQNIHELGLIIRDLKLANFIYNFQTKEGKLVDFGSALDKETAKACSSHGTTTLCEAPENIWKISLTQTKEELMVSCSYGVPTDVYSWCLAVGDLLHIIKNEPTVNRFPKLAELGDKLDLRYSNVLSIMNMEEIEHRLHKDYKLLKFEKYPFHVDPNLMKEQYMISPHVKIKDLYVISYIDENAQVIECCSLNKKDYKKFMKTFKHDVEKKSLEKEGTEDLDFNSSQIGDIKAFYKLIKEYGGMAPTEIIVPEEKLPSIVKLLQMGTDANPDSRPSMEEELNFFTGILQEAKEELEQEETSELKM